MSGKYIPLEHKVRSRYKIVDSGCWEWTGATTRGGYGQVMDGRKNLRAHRAAYMLFVGDIPDGMLVCHSCDNPLCINPDHLWLGDTAANTQDKVMKGRANKGESMPSSKLNEDAVKEIRASNMNIRVAAEKFRVSPVTAWKARERITWRHLDA